MRNAVLVALAVVTASSVTACKKSGSSSAGDGGAASTESHGQPAPLKAGFEGDVTMHVTSNRGDAPMDLVFHLKGGNARVDVPAPSGAQAHVVFDASAQKTYVILDAQHTYLETDHQLQKNFPGPRPLPATITPTGKHETVAGTDCEDWEIVEALGKRTTACVVPGVAFFDFAATRPIGGTPQRGWADELRMKQMFPLRAVESDSAGKELSRIEVTKIEKAPEDDALFNVPSGFKATPTVRVGDFPMPARPR
jgi:hypothetical protein